MFNQWIWDVFSKLHDIYIYIYLVLFISWGKHLAICWQALERMISDVEANQSQESDGGSGTGCMRYIP